MTGADARLANDPDTGKRTVRLLLRAEGIAACLLSILLYARLGYAWTLFALLFLLPDVSFAGYLAGRRTGAASYNAVHTYAGPLLLAAALLLNGSSVAIPLIWIAHIGFDRFAGYGLKYATGFADTHLGRIDRSRASPD